MVTWGSLIQDIKEPPFPAVARAQEHHVGHEHWDSQHLRKSGELFGVSCC